MNRAPGPRDVATERPQVRVFRFESFELDVDARRLTRNGQEIVLPPRVFDLLLALLHAPGVLLTRDRLLAEVWADTVVADSSLTQSISVLRRELETDGHRLIRTIPRVGYRLEVPVQVILRDPPPGPVAEDGAVADPSPAATESPTAPVPQPVAQAGRRVVRRARWVAAGAAGALACLALWWVGPWRAESPARAPAPPSAQALDAYANGRALLERFQPRQALEPLRRAVQDAPDFAPAHLVLARVLDDLGQRVAAREHVDRALALATGLTPEDQREAQALALE